MDYKFLTLSAICKTTPVKIYETDNIVAGHCHRACLRYLNVTPKVVNDTLAPITLIPEQGKSITFLIDLLTLAIANCVCCCSSDVSKTKNEASHVERMGHVLTRLLAIESQWNNKLNNAILAQTNTISELTKMVSQGLTSAVISSWNANIKE